MRLALGLVLPFLLAGPASAQARFVEGCVASAEAEEVADFDPRAVCQCAADGTIVRGIPAADLDALMEYAGAVGMTDAPDEAQAVAAVMAEVLLACALAEGGRPGGDTVAADGGRKTEVASVAPPAAQPSQPPAGIRTGDGTPPVRTQQSGAGAAIRIVG